MSSFWQNWFGRVASLVPAGKGRPGTSRRGRGAARLRLEPLEARELLTIYTFQMTPDRNNIVVRNDPGNPANVQFVQGSTVLAEVSLGSLSGLRVLCDSGTDTLAVDYRYGVPLPSGGLDYEGGIGLDTLNVNDHPTANDAFTLGTYSVQRSDSAPITFPAGLDVVNVNGGSGANTYAVTGTLASCRTTLNIGNGRDTVTVGDAANTLHNNGPVTVNPGTGLDTLNVNDRSTTAGQAFPLGATSVQRSGLAPITFPGGFDVVNVSGGSGANTYTVAATLATCATTLNTGSGQDTVNVGDGGNTLRNNGPVTVLGGGGTRLNLNDQGTTTSQTYTVTATSVSRTGGVAPLTYSGLQSLAVRVGTAAETVNVQGTAAVTATTVNAGPGADTVNVGPGVGGLDYEGGMGLDTLSVNDQATAASLTYTLGAYFVQRSGSAPITFPAGLDVVNVNGGSGANTYAVTGTLASCRTTLNTGNGRDTVTVGDAANTLRNNGPVTVNGGGDTRLDINDQGTATSETYVVTATSVSRTGGVAPFTYSNLQSLAVNAGQAPETVIVQGTVAGTAVSLNGGGGGNRLLGSGAANLWAIAGPDAGSLSGAAYPGPVSFSRVGSLTAGSGGDTFQFADGATLSGNLTGGGADTLDASACSTSVVVDLQTGQATGVGGTVRGIGTVYGGTGNGALGAYNLLIGTGGNYLQGGTGRRNLLVAGGGPSTLSAGDQEDLLIGGTTAYDTEAGLVSWLQIASYWAGSDDYATRVANLTSGNGVPLLDATTVTGNGGGNVMNGNGALALIYTDGFDFISGFDPGSQTVTIVP
jgi:hypothetical protein